MKYRECRLIRAIASVRPASPCRIFREMTLKTAKCAEYSIPNGRRAQNDCVTAHEADQRAPSAKFSPKILSRTLRAVLSMHMRLQLRSTCPFPSQFIKRKEMKDASKHQ